MASWWLPCTAETCSGFRFTIIKCCVLTVCIFIVANCIDTTGMAHIEILKSYLEWISASIFTNMLTAILVLMAKYKMNFPRNDKVFWCQIYVFCRHIVWRFSNEPRKIKSCSTLAQGMFSDQTDVMESRKGQEEFRSDHWHSLHRHMHWAVLNRMHDSLWLLATGVTLLSSNRDAI
jgi:hypothetical protein